MHLVSASQCNLYSINASVHIGACTAPASDVVEEVHGFRSTRWTADEGFFLNEQHFKIRGFCDHNNVRPNLQSLCEMAALPACLPLHVIRARRVVAASLQWSGWRCRSGSTCSGPRPHAPWGATEGGRLTSESVVAAGRAPCIFVCSSLGCFV